MSVRHLEGFDLEHIPNYGVAPCARCEHPRCRCQATRERRPRQRRNRRGTPLCGSCWEDTPERELRRFLEERL